MEEKVNQLDFYLNLIRERARCAMRYNLGLELWSLLQELPSGLIPYDVDFEIHELDVKLLHLAAWGGDIWTVRALKEMNADVNAQTSGGGFSALHLAASMGHREILELLLQWQGVNVEAISTEGFTALHLGACGGHHESVKLLLQKITRRNFVNLKDTLFGRTALHFAVGGGHFRVVDLLLARTDVDICPRDYVMELTPLLLEVMKPIADTIDKRGQCNLEIVRKLIRGKPKQINDRVGPVRNVKLEDVKEFSCKPWRCFRPIQIDESTKFILMGPPNSISALGGVDTNEPDLYKKNGIYMSGHTALHLASTQNNLEVVTHLVKCHGIKFNEPDELYGMTPLHCTIRSGAMQTFEKLMAVEGLDVNAQLFHEGKCIRQSWLPPLTQVGDSSSLQEQDFFWFLQRFEKLDTPLHLAIRVTCSKDLTKVVNRYCNHSKFTSAIYNESNQLPLQIAWLRFFAADVKRSTLPRRENQYLSEALDMLERHPGTEYLMQEINDQKKVAQDSVNAVLVTATLLASITFSALLQPPFGTAFQEYRSRAVRLFWTFNSLSFYFAMYTILCCLVSTLRTMRNVQRFALNNMSTYFALRQVQSVVPLILSVVFGVGAFVTAGYGNLPPASESFMLACTIFGLLLIISKVIHSLWASVAACSDFESPRSKFAPFLFLLLGGPLITPTFYAHHYLFSGVNFDPPVTTLLYSTVLNIGFVGIILYGVIGVITFALLQA